MASHRRRPEALCTQMPDGTGVVLHLGKNCYYPLSRSGVLLWHLFDNDAVVDDDALAAALVARYAIAADVAVRDAAAFVLQLRTEGILADAASLP